MEAPRSTKLDFEVLPAVESDCLNLAEIESLAFNNTKKDTPETNSFHIMFGGYSQIGCAFRRDNLLEKMQNDPTTKFWKAVIKDSNGREKIIGWTYWHYFIEPKIVEPLEDGIAWPPTANADACNEFIGDVALVRANHMSGRRFGWLEVLATLPEYFGKGAGSALLRQGFSTGRELGLDDFWVESSPDGHGLYEKFGFRDAEAVPLDVSKYGGTGVVHIIGMRCQDQPV